MADISIEACLLLQPAIDLWTRKRWYTVAPANHHCNFESSETRLRENPPVWRKETEERGRVNRVFLTICCRGGKTPVQWMQLLGRKLNGGEEAVHCVWLHSVLSWLFTVVVQWQWCYLRPVRGCTSGGCDRAGGATICLGLLTFVLDLANSNRMVWGRSGSNRTPCCKKTGVRHGVLVLHSFWTGWQEGGRWDLLFRPKVGQVKLTGGRKGAKSWLFRLV